MTFQEALHQHFMFNRNPNNDNLPIRAIERKKWGNGSDNGRRTLAEMMATLAFRKGVEIGTRTGESAEMWCTANPEMKLTCIDPYGVYSARPDQEKQNNNYALALEHIRPYKAVIVRETSMNALSNFANESLDFVFIDGDHHFDYVVQDLVCWARKVKKHGMIILHDYCQFEKAGITRAVDAYTHCHRIDPWYITRGVTPSVFWEKCAEHAR